MIITKALTAIATFVVKSFDTPVKWVAGGIGIIWACIEPALPFIYICTFFVAVDCYSAWMLARRVKHKHPEYAKKEGKFNSEYASEIFHTLLIIWSLVGGGYWLDDKVLGFTDFHIGNWIAAIFCMVQIVSVLENCSSCNGSTWARVIQKVLVDKTQRHLNVDLESVIAEARMKEERSGVKGRESKVEAEGDASEMVAEDEDDEEHRDYLHLEPEY